MCTILGVITLVSAAYYLGYLSGRKEELQATHIGVEETKAKILHISKALEERKKNEANK